MNEEETKEGLEAPDAEVNAGEAADPAADGADAAVAPEADEEEGEEDEEIGGDEAGA